jgi:type I restriction enzyme S subunit
MSWPTACLAEVVEFLDSKRRPVKESDRVEGPYPYYGANGQQGWIDGFLFDEPLILLAEDGGHFDNPSRGIAYAIEGKTWVNNHAHVLRAKDRIEFRYLLHSLKNRDVRSYITGSTRAKLTKDGASRIAIPLPPLDEQRRIAAILDQAEELRAKRRAAITLLDQLPQAIFIEMFGDPASNPKGWETKPLKQLTTKIGSGSTPTGGESAYKTNGITLIRSMNIHDGQFVPKGLAYIDETQAAKLGNVVVASNDVLLNITGASVARVALAPSKVLPARVNQHVSILRCANGLSPRFLEALLINPSTKKNLLRVAGAGATREAITKEQLESFEILLPPFEMQGLFADRVEAIHRAKSVHQTALASLDALFSALQEQSFGGGNAG